MNGLAIRVDIRDSATPAMQRRIAALNNPAGMNEAIALRTGKLTHDYLLEIAGNPDYHRTRAKLGGGESTEFLQDAAKSVTFNSDSSAATITIRSPGISRVAHDVTIVPTGGRRFLTIPMSALSYGKTVLTVQQEINQRLFRTVRKGAKAVSKKPTKFGEGDKKKALFANIGGKITPLFALVRSVHQKQDRTLLPSSQAYFDAAKIGIKDFLESEDAKS